MHFAFLFPRFKILSGAERLILKLAQGIVEKGHAVTILCHQFDESCRPILDPQVKLKVSGSRLDYFGNRYLNAAFDYFRSSALARMVQEGIDAVCCFGPGLAASPALLARKKFPVLYFCYEPPRFLYTDRKVIQKDLPVPRFLADFLFTLYGNRDRRLVGNVDGILCNSLFGASQIQEIYGRKASVITHGIDTYRSSEQRKELRQRLGFDDSNIIVLTVNYLHPRKRIDLFLDTIAKAQSSDSSIRGLIVGEGPEKERLVHHPNAATSVFAGFVSESELFHYYQASDIYLHTGKLETFGLSVIEASGNGLPIVSVNEGGPCETVSDAQTGFLTNTDAELLANSLAKLANDSQMRDQFGKSGQKNIRSKYSWSQGAQDFLNAFSTAKT